MEHPVNNGTCFNQPRTDLWTLSILHNWKSSSPTWCSYHEGSIPPSSRTYQSPPPSFSASGNYSVNLSPGKNKLSTHVSDHSGGPCLSGGPCFDLMAYCWPWLTRRETWSYNPGAYRIVRPFPHTPLGGLSPGLCLTPLVWHKQQVSNISQGSSIQMFLMSSEVTQGLTTLLLAIMINTYQEILLFLT